MNEYDSLMSSHSKPSTSSSPERGIADTTLQYDRKKASNIYYHRPGTGESVASSATLRSKLSEYPSQRSTLWNTEKSIPIPPPVYDQSSSIRQGTIETNLEGSSQILKPYDNAKKHYGDGHKNQSTTSNDTKSESSRTSVWKMPLSPKPQSPRFHTPPSSPSTSVSQL